MYINEKIHTDNEHKVLTDCYQLLYEHLPNLMVDNRPAVEGHNEKMAVWYTAILEDGRAINITEDSVTPKTMSISQFLRFVERNNPKTIFKTVNTDEYMCNASVNERVSFYGTDITADVKHDKGIFGGYSIRLEIYSKEQDKTKIQSIKNSIKAISHR